MTEADLESWRQNSSLQEHFLSPVLVVNLKSSSSPIRLCINPAVCHPGLVGNNGHHPPVYLTFNDTVHAYGGSLITPKYFALHHYTMFNRHDLVLHEDMIYQVYILHFVGIGKI